MQLFDTLLVQPIINLLVIFYHGLMFLHIPYTLGFAIVLLTVFIRLIMYPLTTKQLQVSKKMQDMAPLLAKLKDKHKGDMKRQQEATMALYREHNVNPAAGCLPGIIQIVILLFGLYPAMMKILTLNTAAIVATVNGMVYFPALKLSAPWNTDFFGFLLGKTPAELFSTMGLVVLLVPILTAVFQFVQSKMMMPITPKGAVAIQKKGAQEDFATMFQKQSLYLLPIMIGFFSWNFAIGLSLYWNTFTIFGIIQQYKVAGLGGLEEWVNGLSSRLKR